MTGPPVFAEVATVFDRIRVAAAAVADRASLVSVDRARLPEFVRSLPAADMGPQALDPTCHLLGEGEVTAAFVVTLDSINFGSGYFPFLNKRPGRSGYGTIAAALTDQIREQGPWSASTLRRLTLHDCAVVFGQLPLSPERGALMALFARALNSLGELLAAEFAGDIVRLIEAAENRAARLVGLLARMAFFHDVQTHCGQPVPLFKRAQIAASDLALAFEGRGLGLFHDIDQVTIFADNLVPHVLRVDGILRYAPDLAERIDHGQPLSAGSRAEVELRASAVHAVELMVQALRDQGTETTARQLDMLLWNRGQQPAYKAAFPRHRTRTVFY